MRALSRILFLLVIGVAQAADFDWEVQRFSGRDYVSAKKLAEFYNLPRGLSPANKSLSLARGRRSLLLILGSREAEINGVKYVMSFPVVEEKDQYWVSRMDLGKTIEPAFRPERVPGIKPFTTVILDPGHGGRDKGAASPYEREKNFALDVARRVRDELQNAGMKVLMTRNSDDFIELQDRAALTRGRSDAIFVSLHFNDSPNREANGLEIFSVTPRGSPSTEYDELLVRDMVAEYGNVNEVPSFILAHSIYQALQGSGLKMADRGVKRARFAVLRLTRVPAVLVEGGFLSHPEDAKRVASKERRNAYASALAEGIREFQKPAASKKPPRLAADYQNSLPGRPTTVAALPSPSPPAPEMTLREWPEAVAE